MRIKEIASLFLLCFVAVCCGGGGADTPVRKPVLRMGVDSVGGSFVVLKLETLNADRVFLLATDDGREPEAEVLAQTGRAVPSGRYVLDSLNAETAYVVYACAASGSTLGSVESVSFSTGIGESALYSWERRRARRPAFADMVLLYGSWRRDASGRILDWDRDRISPLVSREDASGEEHWLFDAFLALEGRTPDGSRTFMLGVHEGGTDVAMRAANKADAESFIDWWLRPGNGFCALDEAVGEALHRLGTPPGKRYAIMMLPDLPVHERYNDASSSTTYWGNLDGRRLDFGRTADRLAAYRWYVDEVRRRFDEAGFAYIELGGFYPMTEELPTTRPGLPGQGDDGLDGWEQEYKQWDDIYPAISDYVHQCQGCMAWIPYRNAAGYRYTSELGLDQVYMQPNRLWHSESRYSMDSFFAAIAPYPLGIELEFDDNILSGISSSEEYRKRWREYVDGLLASGIYGKRPIALYQDTDSFRNFALSEDETDAAIFAELCNLIASDPLKAGNY